MIGQGRKRIIIEKEVNKDTILEIMQEAMAIHLENVQDYKYLIDYYKGKQDILDRTSESAGYNSKINNKTVVNYAYSSVRDIVGYLFGKNTQYIALNSKYRKDIETISNVFNYEKGALVDHESATFAGITGLSYLFTLPSEELLSDYMPDIPINNYCPDIMTTFIVQSAKVGNPSIMSVTYYTDNKKTYFTCYTDESIYKFECIGNGSFAIGNTRGVVVDEEPNPIGLNPIIMVQNNNFLMGDFEVAISVLNAINQLASDTMNDIQNVIQSLLVIIGAEMTGEVIDKVKVNRVLNLIKGGDDNANIDAKFIYQQLDSAGMQNIREYLEEAYKVIIGIPDRKTRGGGGGDTGDAVKLRDGWADIEIVARIKEQYFKIAKMKQIAVVARIMQKLNLISKDFKTMYIDVTLPRNTMDNLQTRAQAYSTLNGTKTLHPADALDMVGMTTDVDAKIENGRKYWEEQQEKQLEFQQRQKEMSAKTDEKLGINQEQKNQYNTDVKETKARKEVIKEENKANKKGRIY